MLPALGASSARGPPYSVSGGMRLQVASARLRVGALAYASPRAGARRPRRRVAAPSRAPAAQRLAHGVEVPGDVVERAEVRDAPALRAPAPRRGRATPPRPRRRCRAAASAAGPGPSPIRTPATSPTNAVPGRLVQVGDVVGGVARACSRRGSRPSVSPPLSTRRRSSGTGHDLAPQALACRRRRCAWRWRPAATGSAMCGAPRSCTQTSTSGQRAHERAGGAGVVEVDVGQQDRARRPRRRAPRAASRCAGLRPGVDEHAVELRSSR